MNIFDEYIQQSDPQKREIAHAWQTAIGLQEVDGLKPSDFLLGVARRHIEGEISMEEAKSLIEAHYAQQGSSKCTYEEVAPNSPMNSEIDEYNRLRRPELYKDL